MTHQFNHQLRLDRAVEHLQSLEAEERRWREGRPYEVIHERDPQTGKQLVRVEIFAQPPARIGVLVGDVLHSLRSALDNLAYELAFAHTGDPLPKDIAENSQFPIFGPKPMTVGQRKRMIGGVHPDAQAVIEGLQPHQGGHDFASHPLWTLYDLSNIDKHRVPHLALLGVPAVMTLSLGPPGGDTPARNVEWNTGPFDESSAVIARYDPDPAYPHAEVRMHLQYSLGIAFGNRESAAYGMEAVYTLRRLRDHIANNVISPLRPYLTRIRLAHVSQPYSLLPSRG